jgi:hypothetical protein
VTGTQSVEDRDHNMREGILQSLFISFVFERRTHLENDLFFLFVLTNNP